MIRKNYFAIAGIVLVVIAFAWVLGFSVFIRSEDWLEIEKVVIESEELIGVVGEISSVNARLWGFSYRFVGSSWAEAVVNVDVIGDNSAGNYRLELLKRDGVWYISKIR